MKQLFLVLNQQVVADALLRLFVLIDGSNGGRSALFDQMAILSIQALDQLSFPVKAGQNLFFRFEYFIQQSPLVLLLELFQTFRESVVLTFENPSFVTEPCDQCV